MRERGVEATAFSDVLAHSGAPRGSIYHHFPDGKSQLIVEATRYAGKYIAAGLSSALTQQDLPRALRVFGRTWRRILRESKFGAGCAVVAASLDGEHHPAARDEAGVAFSGWIDLLATAIERHGISGQRARSIATLIVASIEGAIILARAQQSMRPLERVVDELELLVTEAIAQASSSTPGG